MDLTTIVWNAGTILFFGGILAYTGFVVYIVKMSTFHHMIHIWRSPPETVSKQLRSAERFRKLMWLGVILIAPSGYVLAAIGASLQVHNTFSEVSPSPLETLWGVMNLSFLFVLIVALLYVVITWSNRRFGWTR